MGSAARRAPRAGDGLRRASVRRCRCPAQSIIGSSVAISGVFIYSLASEYFGSQAKAAATK